MNNEDIILWPDNVWCYRYELEEFLSHKSDDYRVIVSGTIGWELISDDKLLIEDMTALDLLGILAKFAKGSVSGMSLDCAHWPGYRTQYRWVTKDGLGDWKDDPAQALVAFIYL